jgi:uncharacterized protein (TIGR03437 family)
LVIGQTTFTTQNNGATSQILGSISGLAYANDSTGGTLFVADSNRIGLLPVNNRVLMFSNMAQTLPQLTATLPLYQARCEVCLTPSAVNVLGQSTFLTTAAATAATGLSLPLGVAYDGVHVAVADTANNRVLIWNELPTSMGQPADVVLGQPDFVTVEPVTPTSSSLRAPQGVWFQGQQLFVADTQNNRVLIWNSIPTQNNQPANIVLGQPNFTTVPQFDQTKQSLNSSASTLLSPTSVTSDGRHLFVADEGYSRVLIWNSIPTTNTQPADVEVGQQDMENSFGDDAIDMCASNGTDTNGNPTYPNLCASTLSFPRFALSDGTRLFIADSGNDRVLIYNTIPTQNATRADIILGEPDEFSDVVTSSNTSLGGVDLTTSASNVTPTPMSLAWDGTNLYVSDPLDYRVLIFTPATPNVQINGVVNAASETVFATGSISFGGTLNPGDTVTLTIDGVNYVYTEVSGDTFDTIMTNLSNLINQANNGKGDTNVIAQPQLGTQVLLLTARQGGAGGNTITLATTVSDNAQITATVSGPTLTGGAAQSVLGPGTIISILGTNLAAQTASAPANAQTLPVDLGGVEVYIDGIRLPLIFVSPTQINAQVPFEVIDTNSSNLFVRTTNADGSITVSDAIGLPIAPDNPGIFAQPGIDPRPGIAYHGSSFATGTITVTGGVNAGDTATVGVGDRLYNYVVESTDTLATIRDALISLINANPQEVVTASAATTNFSIRLQANVPGPEGDTIPISGSSTAAAPTSAAPVNVATPVSTSTTTSTGSVTLTATNTTLCCANVAGAPITTDNPALAGETIYLYATGLGLVGPNDARNAIVDGQAYAGPVANDPVSPVSAIGDGAAATVISAGLKVGAISIYEVVMELSSQQPTNPLAQISISQDEFTSNVVTIPVYSPAVPPTVVCN